MRKEHKEAKVRSIIKDILKIREYNQIQIVKFLLSNLNLEFDSESDTKCGELYQSSIEHQYYRKYILNQQTFEDIFHMNGINSRKRKIQEELKELDIKDQRKVADIMLTKLGLSIGQSNNPKLTPEEARRERADEIANILNVNDAKKKEIILRFLNLDRLHFTLRPSFDILVHYINQPEDGFEKLSKYIDDVEDKSMRMKGKE